MRNMPGELAWFVVLIYQLPPRLHPHHPSVSHPMLYSLLAKASYLNWPQEPVLSGFNAPYSVDSISITTVTKD